MDKRLLSEIKHGKKISENAGLIWSWDTPAGQKRWARRVRLLTQEIRQGQIILELGCGTGYFTKELVKTKAEVYAIDISPDLIEKAKFDSPQVQFILGDAHATSFSDNTFDKVLGSSVLHHLDYHRALKEIYRLLKPNGRIFFTEPNMLNPQIALQKNIPWLKEKMGDSPDETAFFRWRLKKTLEENGFVNIVIIPFDFLHPSIPKTMVPLFEPFCHFLEDVPFVKEFAGSLFIYAQKI
jgi:SAM-dependent methyltransferase